MKVQPGSSSKSCLGQGRAAGEEREESLPRCQHHVSLVCHLSFPAENRSSVAILASGTLYHLAAVHGGRTHCDSQVDPSVPPSVRPSRGKGPYLPGCPARDEGERGGAGAGALGLPSFLSSSWGNFRNFKNILFYRAMQFIRITNSRIMD